MSNHEPEATRLESADEIMRALEARKARRQPIAAPASGGRPNAVPPPLPDARQERPVQRPPMAVLCICDDGKQEGETVRLRADMTVIGRSEGEVCIGHDVLMSGKHAAVVREQTPAGWRWSLRDLDSRNGTFVRVGNTILRHGYEVLIGQGNYRFEAPNSRSEVTTADAANGTQMPQPAMAVARALVPSLVEFVAAGPVQRFLLSLPEYWIGRDPKQVSIARPDDLFADAKHARLYREPTGQWRIANNDSENGLWFRIKSIPLGKACQFRLGEQRFHFREC